MQRGFHAWQPRLDTLCAGRAVFRRAYVLEETPSTQDAAETRDASPGTFVTAREVAHRKSSEEVRGRGSMPACSQGGRRSSAGSRKSA